MNLRSSIHIYYEAEKNRHLADAHYQSAHRALAVEPAIYKTETEQGLLQALDLIARIGHDARNPNDDLLQMKCYHDLVINSLYQGAKQMQARDYMLKGMNAYFRNECLSEIHPEYFINASSMVIGYVSAIIHACAKSKRQLNRLGYDELVMFTKIAGDILQGVNDYQDPVKISGDKRSDITVLYERLICIYHELRKDDEKIEIAMRGLQTLLNVQEGERTESDFVMMAKLYARLAQVFKNDMSYVPLFNFMRDYFSGMGQVSMTTLKKMINEVNGMEGSQYHAGVLMQFMRLVARTLENKLLPDSELKSELSQHYYQLAFKDLLDQQMKKEDQMLSQAIHEALAILNEAQPKPVATQKPIAKKASVVAAASMFTGGEKGRVALLAKQLEPRLRFDKK